MLNNVILTGNLGADPQVFFAPSSGEQVARFNLAFNSGKDKTSWIKTVCFKGLASVAEKYLHKGARIAISGILDQNVWETETGEQKTTLQIIARTIEFIKTDGRGFDDTAHNAQSFNDEIPF
jgi:single-strand DNA-binding protein